MAFSGLTIVTFCLVMLILHRMISTARNFRIAQRSNFPVIVTPVDITEIWWILLYRRLMPLCSILPHRLTASWLPFVQRFSLWKLGHQPFETVGNDTVILSSPQGNLLQTSHNHQDEPEGDQIFNIWGPTIGSTEGEEWKAHRKIVTAGLGPQTNPLVWDKAVEHTQSLLYEWQQKQQSVVDHVKPWTSKLALHIICATFFNKKLPWTETHSEELTEGHRLTFEQALTTIVTNVRLIFMLPRPLLNRLPTKLAKSVRLALGEWTNYMREMRRDVLSCSDRIKEENGNSLLESIVVGFEDLNSTEKKQLPQDYALGDIFFTLLAGHETIGNTLAFALLLLCVYPEWQVRIQEQIDSQQAAAGTEADKERSWTYHNHHAQLHKGPMAAVIHETLRLYNVVQMVWRRVAATTHVTDSNGTVHELPAGMLCMINFSAAHRNPAQWHPREGISPNQRAELHHSPALDFDPERWLSDRGDATENGQKQKVPTCWPFSQGVRSCPGRGFALIELTAVLSTILKDHSLQLEVDEGRSWAEAREDALRKLVDGVQANLNIEMVGKLPIRILTRKKTE